MRSISLDHNSKIYYGKMFKIGLPIVFQNLINLGLNLIDTLMIGKLGEAPLAAVGIANQVFFVFSVTLFGLLSGAAVYTTQYFGAGNRDGVKKMMGIGFSVSLAFACALALFTFTKAAFIMGLFTKNPVVIDLGAEYLHIACLSYLFFAISMVISYNSRAVQDLKVPTIINFIAILINAILNYIFIFGKSGFSEMGVSGAAIATSIARGIEMLALCGFIAYKRDSWLRGSLSEIFGYDFKMFKAVMKVAFPVVLTEGSWSMSTSMIFAAYGQLGTKAIAAVQVANVMSEFLQSLYFGVGNSTAMIIGETIGKGNREEAYLCGKRSFKAIWFLNIVLGATLILISRPITWMYNFSPETDHLITVTITAMAIAMTPKMIAYMYIVGIFRAGGDTMFSMKLELFCNLLVQVPLAFFAVSVLKVSLPVAVLIVSIGEFIRIAFSFKRFRSRIWINDVIH